MVELAIVTTLVSTRFAPVVGGLTHVAVDAGPYSLNVIVPPANFCVEAAALIDPSPRPPVPGSFAVLPRCATSLTALPELQAVEHVAVVVNVGVLGRTSKHSLKLVLVALGGSEAFGTPNVPEVKLDRQQYRPALVSVVSAEW